MARLTSHRDAAMDLHLSPYHRRTRLPHALGAAVRTGHCLRVVTTVRRSGPSRRRGLRFLFAPWPLRWFRYDLALNFIAYVPFGFFVALLPQRASPAARIALPGVVGFVSSFAMESLQMFFAAPQRQHRRFDREHDRRPRGSARWAQRWRARRASSARFPRHARVSSWVDISAISELRFSFCGSPRSSESRHSTFCRHVRSEPAAFWPPRRRRRNPRCDGDRSG